MRSVSNLTALMCSSTEYLAYIYFLALHTFSHLVSSEKGCIEYVNHKMQCKNWKHSRKGCEQREENQPEHVG